MRVPVVLLIFWLIGFGPVLADSVDLRDGKSIQGTISQQGDHVIIKGDDGSTLVVGQGDILRVNRSTTVSKAEAARNEWERNAAQISSSSDLAGIIGLHQKFLDKYGDQPIAAKARLSLEDYQKLADQHAVRFRGEWMPQAQAEPLQREWNEKADAALADYAAGRLSGAKRAFINLLRDDPNSVIALNNLAVIAARQNSPNESMNYYAKALQAAPDNRLLLDNVAEEILLQGDPENSAALRLHRLWENGEKQVAPAMAKQDLYRWGGGWVSRQDLSVMQSMTRDLQTQIDPIAQRYNSDQASVDRLNDEMDANQRDYADAEENPDPEQSDADRDRLTQEYNDLNDALTDAESALSDDEADAEPLVRQLASIQHVGFTGVQRMMFPADDIHPPPPPRVKIPAAR